MSTTTDTQLAIAQELVETLDAIKTGEKELANLHARRAELLQSLHDGVVLPTAPGTPPVEAKPADKPKAVRPKKGGAEHPPAEPITPEAQAEYEQQDELYPVEKITEPQARMIFALLGTEHGFTDDQDKKDVIRAIVAKQHNGWKLESTKDLSKVWATDVIDYLKKHDRKHLEGMLVPF